jgi:hypothetical protein
LGGDALKLLNGPPQLAHDLLALLKQLEDCLEQHAADIATGIAHLDSMLLRLLRQLSWAIFAAPMATRSWSQIREALNETLARVPSRRSRTNPVIARTR